MSSRSFRDEAGFSLVELMVVVLIIAVLIAIAVPTFLGFKRRADDVAAKDAAVLTVKTARGLTDDDGSYTGLTGAALTGSQPGLTYVDGALPSTGPSVASHDVVGSGELFVSVYSRSASCFFVHDRPDAGTRYGVMSPAAVADCRAANNGAIVFASSW
jgi:type IV pilus assembly protein PilA